MVLKTWVTYSEIECLRAFSALEHSIRRVCGMYLFSVLLRKLGAITPDQWSQVEEGAIAR